MFLVPMILLLFTSILLAASVLTFLLSTFASSPLNFTVKQGLMVDWVGLVFSAAALTSAISAVPDFCPQSSETDWTSCTVGAVATVVAAVLWYATAPLSIRRVYES